jgi:hypothetical protein
LLSALPMLLRSRDIRAFCTLALAIAIAPGAAAADGTVDVRVAYGYDSNPLELADGDGDAFTEAGLTASLKLRPEQRTQFFLRVSGAERYHGSDAEDADSTRAAARAAVAFIPYRKGTRRVALVLGGDYRVKRSTFVDPETGNVFEYIASDALGTTLQSIADRFDSDTLESFVDLRVRVNRRVRLRLEARHEQRDYVEDYPEIDGLESIDFEALELEPGIRIGLVDGVGLTLGYASMQRDYDEQPALDAAGNTVAGVEREYEDDGYHVANDPNGEVRGLDAWSGYGRFERDLAKGFGLFVELGAQRVDNEEPVLAYDKDWAMTGFQFRR